MSIAVHGSLLYVANGGVGGSNYTGFRLNAGGSRSHIGRSTFDLPDIAMPGHVLISPDGRRLVGTRVGPTRVLRTDGFSIGSDGPLTPAPGSPFAAQRIVVSPCPFPCVNAPDGTLAGVQRGVDGHRW